MEKVQWNSINKKQNGIKQSKNKSSTLPRLTNHHPPLPPLVIMDWFLFQKMSRALASKYGEGWLIFIFRSFNSISFLLVEFPCIFPYLIKYYTIIWFWLGSAISSEFLVFFSCLLYFVPYSRLSSYRFRLFLHLILFLLLFCLSVWENTRAWVPHFLQPYWMVPSFFAWWKQWRIGSPTLSKKKMYQTNWDWIGRLKRMDEHSMARKRGRVRYETRLVWMCEGGLR